MLTNQDTFVEIDGLNICYSIIGEGNINVLFLHGWGASKHTFDPVINILSKEPKLKITSLDFPGFGKSDTPKTIIGTLEYEKITLRFIEKLGLKNIILVGHSFGGRIAIRIASSKPELVDKMILVDSAGIKPKRKLSYYTKVWSFKFSKMILKLFYKGDKFDQKMQALYKKHGSSDYKNANNIMRQILVKVVNEDLTSLLSNIKAPTLLIWGELDNDTHLWMAKKMETLIKDAGLVVFKGAGHYSFIDKLSDFCIIITKFIIG